MSYVDEIISVLEKVTCPKDYESCPVRIAGNDCDNQCIIQDSVDMLKDYKVLKEHLYPKELSAKFIKSKEEKKNEG